MLGMLFLGSRGRLWACFIRVALWTRHVLSQIRPCFWVIVGDSWPGLVDVTNFCWHGRTCVQLTVACIVRILVIKNVTMRSHARQDCRTEIMKQSKAWLCTEYLHNVTGRHVRAAGHERSFYKSFYNSCRLHTAHVTWFWLIELNLFTVSSQQGIYIFPPNQKALEWWDEMLSILARSLLKRASARLFFVGSWAPAQAEWCWDWENIQFAQS